MSALHKVLGNSSGASMNATALPIGRRTGITLMLASIAGIAIIAWPLFVAPSDPSAADVEAPLMFIVILPIIVLTVLAQFSEGGMDSKALAMLGVLSAINAALRPLGAGVGGVETVFFLLILAGRVYGAGFGFVLGCTSLFASALLTAGVGPWLPFQMITSAWIGLGAGLLPKKVTGKVEVLMLAVYGAVSAYAFGALMNLWFWPFAVGMGEGGSSMGFIPGDPLWENLKRFITFTLLTSTGGWDTGRAITNVLAIVILGPAILAVLRRSVRRASFGAPVSFTKNYASGLSSSEFSSSPSSSPESSSSSSALGSSGSSSGTSTGTQSGKGVNGSSGVRSTPSVGRNES